MDIRVGDLVTYLSIKELTQENYQQKITIHGIGVVVTLDDEFAKVYWIHARQFLWVMTNKLTTFNNLTSRY
jgi:YbbR domain-containing protein